MRKEELKINLMKSHTNGGFPIANQGKEDLPYKKLRGKKDNS